MAEFTSYLRGTPCWVDVTSNDMSATNAFYSGLFGWNAEDLGEEAGGYTMYSLRGKRVAAGSPPPAGAEGAPPQWTTYLASDDVDETVGKIRDAGGTVLMEPFDVFDSGRMAIAHDPPGASFGVWQAGTHIGAQLANEHGTLNWNQCQTDDPGRAAQFYADVFGYGVTEIDLGGGEPFRVLEVDGRGVAGVRDHIPQLGDMPAHWSTVFAVDDTDAAVAAARELGGTVVMEPLDLPDIGRIAVLRDPVGAVFQVIQPPSQ
jgi:uncharacterized protein